jgi:two-component system CheB/CheR fusion protein
MSITSKAVVEGNSDGLSDHKTISQGEEPSIHKPYVVGIGASAGGLEALERFFAAVPVDSGMVYVVIQHLSPDFKSLMDELLGRVTPLKIVRVLEPEEIRPNTVYILPPRKEMVLQGECLLTFDKPTDQPLSLPINTFFRSLAREWGEKSIAIVLSGTGSDGSIGIQDVHDVGGLVFVQSVETAKFDGMPRSAINTGCVDSIMPPEEMPAALIGYVQNPNRSLLDFRPGHGEPLTGVSAVFEKLREIYDLDFNYYKSATVSRRIDRRVLLGATGVFQDYIDLVLRDDSELDKLYKDLLIGVTRFFRDAEAFQLIAQRVIPSLLESHPPEEELRVWVACCATGEEAYSVAMLFMDAFEQLGREPNIKIFATDMHRESLQKAAEGVFSEDSIAAVMPVERRERYFHKESGGFYRVSSRLRKLLIFSQHNLIKDPPFTRVDFISCRNMLIYLEPVAQNRVIATFHFSLKPNAYLFLGPSEGTADLGSEFTTVDRQWKIFCKSSDARLPLDMRMSLGVGPIRMPANMPLYSSSKLPKVYDQLLNNYMPTGVLVNDRREVVYIFGNANRYLQPSVGRMSNDLVSLTQGDLRIALSSVIQNGNKKGQWATLKGIRYQDAKGKLILNVSAEPITDKSTGTNYTMVLLEEQTLPAVAQQTFPTESFDVSEEARSRILNLEHELQHTREALQSTIEELETSGEELQASNEELLASNEEMQSTNEELHSVNEELYSVNAEHEQKIKELNELTSDWRNLMRSTDIGVIFLNGDYSIRLFSPKATEIFNLLPMDIGRDMRHITSKVGNDEFFDILAKVMNSQQPVEKKLALTDGRTFLRRVLPYVDDEKASKGIVITLIDITDLAQIESALRENENRFRGMVEALGEGIMLIDQHGSVLSCNGEAARLFGLSSQAMIGLELSDLQQIEFHGEEGLAMRFEETPFWRTLQSGTPLKNTMIGIRHVGGADCWAIMNTVPISTRGETGHSAVLASLTDVTDRKEVEQELRISAVAFEATEGIMVTDAQGNILRVNQAFTAITGYGPDEVIGHTPSLLHSGLQDDEFYQEMWQQLGRDGSWRGEVLNKRKDGKIYPEWLTISAVQGAAGEITHYVGTFTDISARKEAEEKIREMAFFDPLTSLPNRRLFIDRLEHALASSARNKQYGAVVMLDLDNFKNINDVHGHDVGDGLLIEVANRLRANIRDSDTVSRLGGDEFVIIFEGLGNGEGVAISNAEEAVEKIRACISEPYHPKKGGDGNRHYTAISGGVCLFLGQGISTDELMKQADIALYQAKSAGRNVCKFYSESVQHEINMHAQIEAGLHLALKEGQFRLLYQPQVDETGKIVCAEALLRWLPTENNVVAPLQFIPLAEKSGLILPIGGWVLEVACATLQHWACNPKTAGMNLAINISARQFREPVFYEKVRQTLHRFQVNPLRLELELTESVFLDDLDDAFVKIQALKALGIRISLDDFGSGYSSLTYLKRLPFDKLKIDQAFVRDITVDTDDAVIVRTIIAMGLALRLEVIAEGVETDAQRKYLYDHGCRAFQGYLFSPPVTLDSFYELLQHDHGISELLNDPH